MSFKVSVILPVYNVEEYLEKCLDSLINQTLDEIEIICVDDGSTDNSSKILYEYSEKHKNITVISQKNKGAGAARNPALKQAKGEYISFVDPDDWVEKNTYELTYKKAKEKNLDIIIFKGINYDHETEKLYETDYYNQKPLKKFKKGEIFNYNDFDLFNLSVTVWNKLYKNSYLKKINAKFPEGLIYDDNLFFYEIILETKKIGFLNKFLYFRRRRKDSIMGNIDKKHFDIIPIQNKIIDIFKRKNIYEKHEKSLLNKKINEIKIVNNRFNKDLRKEFFPLIKEDFTKIKNNSSLFKEYKNNLTKQNLDFFINSIQADNYTEFDYNNLKIKYELCSRELDRIYHSKSWKITKALRKIMNKIR